MCGFRAWSLLMLLALPLVSVEPSWKDQLDKLDKQIQALSLQIDSYRHQALAAENSAQNQMQSNFPVYIQDIQDSEKYEELSRNAEKQMKLLMQEREELIATHAQNTPSNNTNK